MTVLYKSRARLGILLSSLILVPAAAEEANRPQTLVQGIRDNLAQVQQTQKRATTQRPMTTLALLQKRSGKQAPVIQWRSNGTPRHIQGNILEQASKDRFRTKKARNLETALKFLRLNRALLKIKNPDREFTLTKQSGNRLRFDQQYQGLPVWPSEISIHLDAQGNVNMMNGAYVPTPRRPMRLNPVVTAELARDKAMAGRPAGTQATEPVLIIYAPGEVQPRLAWRLEVHIAIDKRLIIVVDALLGDILTEFNQIHAGAVTGSGTDLQGQTRPLQLFEENGQFFLYDTSKPMFDAAKESGMILIYDWKNQPEDADVSAELLSSNNANAGFLPDGISAAYSLSETYDYYYEHHGRNSLDGDGGSMLSVVRVGNQFENAFWNGQAMFFGDALPYAASLDVAGHEMTHGVVETTAALVYQNQAGALNEAFADIFGEMVEKRTKGQADWLLGADTGEILRSFLRPEDYNQPSKMSNFITLPNTTEGDNGGVHVNSGIINHAYYLLAEGLNGAIGTSDAEKIFYRALTTYLVKNSQFVDARLAVLDAAKDLFGADSTQYQKAAEAFDSVEITANQASTTPPPSFPPVSGSQEDAVLFACLAQDGFLYVCRYEPALDSEPVILSWHTLATKSSIAVEGSGQMAAFVTQDRDLCLIRTDGQGEACLGIPGTVWSVAMSPDARYYAFVLLDAMGNISPSITVVDMVAETEQTYALVAPAIDSDKPISTIVGADALTFTAGGQTVMYDALNVFRAADGTQTGSWAIYGLDIETGITYNVITPSKGKDVGFPKLSQTSDNFMVFDLYDEQSGQLQVHTVNLNTGDFSLLAAFQGEGSVPSYTGDDGAIVYTYPDSSAALGYQLVQQQLGQDRRTPQGEPATWLKYGAYGTIYRRGQFIGPQTVAAYFDLRTGIMRINAVTVGTSVFQVDLKLIGVEPLTFQVVGISLVTETPEISATYSSGEVQIPLAELTDPDGNTTFWSIQLEILDPNSLTFFIPEGGLKAM